MNLIIIIAVIWSASALIRSAREKRAAENAQRIANEQARIKREMREMKQRANEEVAARIAMEREQMRQAKAIEKHEAELAKHEKRISDLETRMSQAEYDIRQEQENLNHFTGKLADLDEEKRHIEWEIESWKKQRHLANIAKCEKKLEKVEDNIFSFESKVRAAEKRLDKAQRTKDFCEKQMSA